jgi:threonylcarbamoyladenosine tRNA methylthiotransferase CDKAL1
MFLFLAYAFNVLRWWTVRVFVKSFGCSSNLADGDVIAGCLAKAGCELVDSLAEADVVVYNTCAVKAPTEDRAIMILRRVPKSKKLIVAGCLPLVNFERLHAEVRFDGVTGPASADHVVDIVKRVSAGERVVDLSMPTEALPELDLPRRQLNPVVSVVPINYGCLGSCSYCCVKRARGRLRSYALGEIVKRIRRDLNAGFREFWLTSQDTGAYGRDIKTDLCRLLWAIQRVEADFWVRVGMMTPNLALDILDGLVKSFQSDRVFRFVHLPVQSGNDEILAGMRRAYTTDEFMQVVNAFRAAISDLTISTDIICGFPGEDESAFQDTLRLIEHLRPDVVNTSKFFARPGTPAQSMRANFVSVPEIKKRSAAVTAIARRIAGEKNEAWMGWEGSILIDELGKVGASWIGRNYAYKPVVVRSSRNLLGKTVHVRVVEAFDTYLMGKIS